MSNLPIGECNGCGKKIRQKDLYGQTLDKGRFKYYCEKCIKKNNWSLDYTMNIIDMGGEL